MRLTSRLDPDQVVPLVKLIATDSCYPLEECLKECIASDQIEASALLSKRIGKY